MSRLDEARPRGSVARDPSWHYASPRPLQPDDDEPVWAMEDPGQEGVWQALQQTWYEVHVEEAKCYHARNDALSEDIVKREHARAVRLLKKFMTLKFHKVPAAFVQALVQEPDQGPRQEPAAEPAPARKKAKKQKT